MDNDEYLNILYESFGFYKEKLNSMVDKQENDPYVYDRVAFIMDQMRNVLAEMLRFRNLSNSK